MSIRQLYAHVTPRYAVIKKRRHRPTVDLLQALAVPVLENIVLGEFSHVTNLAAEVGASANVVRTALGKGPSGRGGAQAWPEPPDNRDKIAPCQQNIEIMMKYLTSSGELELRRRLNMTEQDLSARIVEVPDADPLDYLM